MNRTFTAEQLQIVARTAAMLSVDQVQQANSGHPGAPMGMSDLWASLWLNHLNFDPLDTKWVARDRIVLSNGHAVALWYSYLHLSGQLSLEALKQFRQWKSLTPGHPEYPLTPGIEATTGPLGQGIANAVGLAIASLNLRRQAGSEGEALFASRIWCFVGDGCLMEGISHEAAALAGHLKLENLTVIYDSNRISIDGSTGLTMSEDVAQRFRAYGFHVIEIDGHDFRQIEEAYAKVRTISQPTLIIATTTIGNGSPNKAGKSSAHGEPLGNTEVAETKRALGWPEEPFHVPTEVPGLFARLARELALQRSEWGQQMEQWTRSERGAALSQMLDGLSRPATLLTELLAAIPDPGKPIATRKLSAAMLKVAFTELPGFIGGSADLTPSNLTRPAEVTDFTASDRSGRYLRFGVREHAMAAIVNGIALSGTHRSFGATFLQFFNYMAPSVRLAALSHLPSLFVFTHDSFMLGEDGPTHQPVEHLMWLRQIPNLWTFRPANGREMAAAYFQALQRPDGPCCIVCSRQDVEPWLLPSEIKVDNVLRGGYLAYESKSEGETTVTIVATGSEVPLAVAAANLVTDSHTVRVVSMPCVEVFNQQTEDYRRSVIPKDATILTLEAGSTVGWSDLLGGTKRVQSIGLNHFGDSAPAAVLREQFGFTPEAVARVIQQL